MSAVLRFRPHRVAVPTSADQRWGDLIARTAHGDERALAALYDATGPTVYAVAMRILGDAAVAEEVTMDVFLQVWNQAERWDPARGAPLTWLATLARSRAIDRRRSGAAQRAQTDLVDGMLDAPHGGPGPEEDAAVAERRRLVRGALEALQPTQRTALELAWFHGLSHVEIAARLGAPLGTVKTRIRTAMASLRDALEPLGGVPL